MKIVFFGNGNFSTHPLKSLMLSNHEIKFIVTDAPKKIKKRGSQLFKTPLLKYAHKNKLNTVSFDEINNDPNHTLLKDIKPDLFVVIEFKKISKSIFNIPKYGTINIHASLLPSYRGAAPIQRAIMNGEKTIGLSSFYINEIIDAGDIILRKAIDIDDIITYGECYDRLSLQSGKFLINTIDNIQKGIIATKQSNIKCSYAKKIHKNDCLINFNNSAISIHNQIRGLNPKPGAYAIINNKRVKLINTYYTNDTNLKVGEHMYDNEKIYIGCNQMVLIVKEFQFENKKVISAKDFSNITNLKNTYFE